MTIIYTILIFGAIIFIHELGHFTIAKLSGITVHEFALGMGPTILKKEYKGTKYALRLFPIGGFVQMEGEDEESDDVGSFNKKPIYKRMAVVVAGATMNLLLGFLIMLAISSSNDIYNSTTIAKFYDNATTKASGLMEKDKILKMNNTNINIDKDIIFELVNDKDGIMPMVVLRDGEKVKLPEVKFQVSGEGAKKDIKIDFSVMGVKRTVFGAISQAYFNTYSIARNSIVSVVGLVTGNISINELSGPVGVGQAIGQAAKQSAGSVFQLAAFISISIGMFNLLPFPALDGGRFVFLIIEAIRRKPINPKYEAYVNGAGLILLFGLMIFVTFKDVINLF